MHPAPRAVAPGSLEQRPVTALKGVGEALAARLAVLGVHQVQDLLGMLSQWSKDLQSLSPESLQRLMQLGAGVSRLLELKDKLLGK